MKHSRLNLDLLFKVPSVLTYDISPDGKVLALTWNKSGQRQVHLIRDKTEEQATFPPESKIIPKFSPSKPELIYSQDHQGDELYDLYLYDLTRKQAHNITPNTPEAIYPSVRWSPDGKSIAYSSNKPGKFTIHTVLREGGEPKIVHTHDYVDYDPRWSPDGKIIAFTALVKAQDENIFIANLDDSSAVQLSNRGKPVESSRAEWSPDGKSIAFMSAELGMYDIGLYRLEEQSVEWLTDSKHEYSNPVWSPKGDRIVYEANVDGNFPIKIQELGGKTETVQLAPGIHSEARFSPDGEGLYFLYDGPKHPSDLWKYSFKTRQFTQLTRSLPSQLDTSNFVSPTSITYNSSDGKTVPALLYVPKKGRGPRPAVVYIHGGPTSQYVNSWSPLIQEYLDRGFSVIAPNYRGSTGYGREFREANRFVMGQLDLDDVAKSVDYLVQNRIANPRYIAVTGGSFGGYLTMCALTRYPDKWAAGSAIVPFLNWFTEMANERDDLQYWDRENMGDPEKDKERLRDASPIFFIDRIRAPVQMIAGAHDPRCPVSETIQAKEAIEKTGRKAEVLIYQDEGHGFLKLDNRLDAYKKSVNFLSQHLAG